MDRNAPLQTFSLQPDVMIVQAQPWSTAAVTLDAPALQVMTDLRKVKAATTQPTTSLEQAERLMIYQGVRMLFVVSGMPSLEGLITSTDLHGDRALRAVQQRGLRYDELAVADAMTPLALLTAVDVDQMHLATVGNVVATLRRSGRHHLLVVWRSADATAQQIVGIVSRTQVERQLGAPIDMVEVADSFAEIEQLLA